MKKILLYSTIFISVFVFYFLCNAGAAVFNVTDATNFQSALTTAQSNGEDDTINVAAGTYNVSTTLTYSGFEAFSLTIQGAGAGTTILDGGNTVRVMALAGSGQITASDITFQNGNSIAFDPSTGLPPEGGGLNVSAGSVTIENCAFLNNTATGNGGGLITRSPLTLKHNTFLFNQSSAFGGGAFTASPDVTVVNNVFSMNQSSSIATDGLYISQPGLTQTIVVTNNTFYSDLATSFQLNVEIYEGTMDIWNNISHPRLSIPDSVAINPVITANIFNNMTSYLFIGLTKGTVSQGGNIITADPQLVDPTNGDVHLQASSQAIDAGGNSAPDLPATDIDGDNRILNGTVDIGADEFVPGLISYYCDDDLDGYIDSSIDGTCTGSSCVPVGCQITAGNDCDDNDSLVNPGTVEGPVGDPTCSNGKDDNCDGLIDANDANCTICIPSVEICDGLDNDCDGQTDEGLTRQTTCGVGECASVGTETCVLGVWSNDTCTPGTPTAEVCDNGLDDNCDGQIDETCAPSFTLTIVKSGTGSGMVKSPPKKGIDCGLDCSETYAEATKVKLEAIEDPESKFTGWSGDCTGSTPDAKVMVDGDKTCTATFMKKTYKLKVVITGNGKGNGKALSDPIGIDCGQGADLCAAKYESGTLVTLTATDNINSKFIKWTGCDKDSDPKANTCTVTMDKRKTVTAKFKSYKLKVAKSGTGAKGGTVTSDIPGIDCSTDCKERYAPDTVVTLTATSDSTATFTKWSEDTCGTATTCTVTMDMPREVTAKFKATN